MLSYDRLSSKPHLFKSFTGLSVQQFDDIFKEIESKYPKYEIKRLSHKKERRERSIGGGRHFKLEVRDRIIMVLVYYRLYITYTLMDFLFGLDQSNVCRDIQKIEALIRECLPIPQKLHKITRRLNTKEEVEKYFPAGFLAFTDCTEQPIPRPKSKKRKSKFYSGKKKKHTVKNLYTSNQRGLLVYKTKHKQRGRKHDYRIYKDNHFKLPNEVTNVFDLGFLGVEKDYPEQLSSLPYKKKKGCELTVEQKEYNRNHTSKRIVIEHVFCRLKKYRILNDIYRNKLRKYNKISDIVSGLVNYRIMNIC